MVSALELMDKVQMPELAELRAKVNEFLEKCIPGMISGGVHTPNHRWVITGALARLYAHYHDERLKKRAYEFLGEQLDMNEAGEWTERSNAVYNAACDLYGYHIGEVFGEEMEFEAVRKNLTMMEYMLHDNNCIVTEFSIRQDRGVSYHLNEIYAVAYLLMAARDQDPLFADMARRAMETLTSCGLLLHYVSLYEKEFATIPEPRPISDRYTRMFNAGHVTAINKRRSGWGDPVLRHRSGKFSVTLMAGQPQFLYVQFGDARAFNIRVPADWFGFAGISFPTIEEVGPMKYRLFTPMTFQYLDAQPAEQVAQFHGDWNAMNQAFPRKQINHQTTEAEVFITIQDNGVDLDITCDKMPLILMQLFCEFDPEGTLSGENLEPMSSGVLRPTAGKVVYTRGNDCISVAGEANGHKLGSMRNDIVNDKVQNVAFNAISPRDWHIEIRGFEKN